MEKSQKRQQLVIAIQEFAAQKGMGPADVYRLCLDRNADVSESSVRRILKADPDKENFSFDVLQRVSGALFNVNAQPVPAEQIDSAAMAEREALRAVSALSDAALQEAQGRIAQLEAQLAAANNALQDMSERKQHFKDLYEEFRQQSHIKDEQIARKDEQLNHRAHAMMERWQIIERLLSELDELKALNASLVEKNRALKAQLGSSRKDNT